MRSIRPRRSAPTSPTCAISATCSPPSNGRDTAATTSCMWPRAFITTMRRPMRWACIPPGSTAGRERRAGARRCRRPHRCAGTSALRASPNWSPPRSPYRGARRKIAMRLVQGRLDFDTKPREIKEITAAVANWLEVQGVADGLLSVYLPHTSASLLIQENASPEVRHDLDAFLRRLVPEKPGLYRHDDEGPDDMPAHIKSALLPTQLMIPLSKGRLQLGAWQGIFLFEHRAHPHRRTVLLTLIGMA